MRDALETATFQQDPAAAALPVRPLGRSIGRGLLCRCPQCGKGRLFDGYLKSVDACAVCGEEIGHHRADDLPPYLTVFIVGHLVVTLFLALDEMAELSMAVHLAIFVPLTVLLSLALLRPLKGATIGLQWAWRMHGFGGDEDQPADR